LTNSEGLGVRDNTNLYVGGTSIFEFDISNTITNVPVITELFVLPNNSSVTGDIQFNSTNNRLIITYSTPPTTKRIGEFTTGGTIINSTQYTTASVFSLYSYNNNTYGIDAGGRVYLFNPTTLVATFIQQIPGLTSPIYGAGQSPQCVGGGFNPPVTQTPTQTTTQTPTNTSTPTNTNTETPTNTPTNTQTQTQTSTQTPTNTPTNTLTNTPTNTPTNTLTNTPTNTTTNTNTQTSTNTPTNTNTPTVTPTNTNTPTVTPTNGTFVFKGCCDLVLYNSTNIIDNTGGLTPNKVYFISYVVNGVTSTQCASYILSNQQTISCQSITTINENDNCDICGQNNVP
jgi:hypothetical protein